MLTNDKYKMEKPENLVELIRAKSVGELKSEIIALEAILQKQKNSINGDIRRNKHQLKTLFHDTILAIIENIKGGKYEKRKNSSFEAYVISILRNKQIDYLRKKRNKIVLEIEERSTDREHEKYVSQDVWNKILKSLDEKCKEIFELRWMKGLPFNEIAELLNATVHAVKKRHERCLKEAKKLKFYYDGRH